MKPFCQQMNAEKEDILSADYADFADKKKKTLSVLNLRHLRMTSCLLSLLIFSWNLF
jgi:hypothetical protein